MKYSRPQFGIRLPAYEADLLRKKALRENKKPTSLATELICKTLRRQLGPVPRVTKAPTPPAPASPVPLPTATVTPPAPPQAKPQIPKYESPFDCVPLLVPLPLLTAADNLASASKTSKEWVIVSLAASMLSCMTNESALLMLKDALGYKEQIEILEGLKAETLKPILTYFEFSKATLEQGTEKNKVPTPPGSPS